VRARLIDVGWAKFNGEVEFTDIGDLHSKVVGHLLSSNAAIWWTDTSLPRKASVVVRGTVGWIELLDAKFFSLGDDLSILPDTVENAKFELLSKNQKPTRYRGEQSTEAEPN
jgi:hypothetical protein